MKTIICRNGTNKSISEPNSKRTSSDSDRSNPFPDFTESETDIQRHARHSPVQRTDPQGKLTSLVYEHPVSELYSNE